MATVTADIAAKRFWTDDELMSLPKDGKYELVNGELKMNAAAGMEHGDIAVTLSTELNHFVRKHKLGVVLESSTGFRLSNGNVRAPDVSFVSKERLRGMKRLPKSFFNGAPDLAVEILSPKDTMKDIHERLADLFSDGTRLAWVISPKKECVFVYRKPQIGAEQLQSDELLRAGDELKGEDVVPNFSLAVAELFAELNF